MVPFHALSRKLLDVPLYGPSCTCCTNISNSSRPLVEFALRRIAGMTLATYSLMEWWSHHGCSCHFFCFYDGLYYLVCFGFKLSLNDGAAVCGDDGHDLGPLQLSYQNYLNHHQSDWCLDCSSLLEIKSLISTLILISSLLYYLFARHTHYHCHFYSLNFLYGHSSHAWDQLLHQHFLNQHHLLLFLNDHDVFSNGHHLFSFSLFNQKNIRLNLFKIDKT